MPRVRRISFVPEDVTVTDYSVNLGSTWKDIIFLPFYRLSIYGCAIVVYMTIAIAIFTITFQPSEGQYSVFIYAFVTICDGLFMARTVLAILHRVYTEHQRRKIYQPDPAVLLIIDTITLIPVGLYCALINQYNWYNPIDYRIGNYYSYALKLPRLIRIYYWYTLLYHDLSRHPRTIILLAHLFFSLILILILGSLYFVQYYYVTDGRTWADSFKDVRRTNISYKTPVICFLYAGGFFYNDILTQMPTYSLNELRLAIAAMLIGYLMHYVYLTSHLVAIYVQLMRFKHFFEWRLVKVEDFTKMLNFEQPLQDAINTYYRTIWVERGGFVTQPDIVNLFPLQLRTEIALDIYFDAIRHTKILSKLDESAKKELSLLFQTELYIPGQLMFQKDKCKSKLVYLHSGIVAVMSNENRDSPVLSFSPGTILGEISCLLPYMCSADIRCSTTCVAHVLKHRALSLLISKDAALEAAMKRVIRERIDYAKNKLQRMRYLEKPLSHIFWIKARWRKLSDSAGKPQGDESLTKFYCSRYLRLLVISTYYELKVHTICIRGNCPFVMEQDSSFRKFLDLFCTTIVVIHFVITFRLIIYEGRIDRSTFALLTLFDFVYLLDIYFQASTSVRVNNMSITKSMDILVHKCKQTRFLLDVFASIPYDYLAQIMGAPAYYVGLCRLPKYIKLMKVVEFFGANEQLLSMSTRTMQILKALAIHVLIITVGACGFYMWTCFNLDCAEDGWLVTYKSRTKKDMGRALAVSDFLVSLIYTSSVYLQMKIHHLQPVNVMELFAQFVVGICGFYLLNMTVVQMSGAIALGNYPRFLYMYNLSIFESVFADKAELRKFKTKVMEFISVQWFYANSMRFSDISTLMNHKSKFVRHKVHHDFTIQTLRRTQIFCHLSDAFLDQISQYIHLYIVPPGHVFQRPNTSAADVYIVLDGYCKVHSFAPQDIEKENFFYIKRYDVFPIVGFFHAVDSFVLVETYTAVKVLCISYLNYVKCCTAHGADGRLLARAITSHLKDHKNLILRIVHLPLLHYPEPEGKGLEDVSIDHNLMEWKEEVEVEVEQHLHWRKVRTSLRSKIFEYLKMTYDPNGKPYLYYEIFRSLLILIEVTVLYLSLHRFIRMHPITDGINIALLLSHIFDVYVRAHVQYFTELGIRVSDPRSTTINYLNRSFFVDLISSLPYERLQIFEIFRSYKKNSMNVFVTLILSPLKLYRPYGLLNIMRRTIGIKYHNVILAVTNTLVLLVFCGHAAAFALAMTCSVTDDWHWVCPKDSWLHLIDSASYWHDNDLLYTRAIYELLIGHVMRSSRYFTYHDYVLFLGLGTAKTIVIVWFLASLIGYTAFSTKYLRAFQERRRRYNNYAARTDIPKDLRFQLMEHYEYMFKKTRTDDPQELYSTFYPHLSEILKLSLYGPTLHEVDMFAESGKAFYRFIVPFITEQYYVMDAVILRCNDITSSIFFVKKGAVEISVADQTMAVLGVGGMFGCFKKNGSWRGTIHVVAKVHTDILVISTARFFEVIRPYSRIKSEMKMASFTNREYFGSRNLPYQTSYIGASVRKFGRFTVRKLLTRGLNDKNRVIMFYRYFTAMHLSPIVSIVALASMLLSGKAAAVELYWIVFDVYFLVDMYLICRIAHTDEDSGLVITSVWQLTRKYLRSWRFYMDVFTLLPLYLIMDYVHMSIKGYLLVNKAFRISRMLVYYNTYLNTRYLPNHIRFTYLMYMLMWFFNVYTFLLVFSRQILEGKFLEYTQVVAYYVYVLNVFTSAGVHPLPMDSIYLFFYMAFSILLTFFLYVLITAGFCKLAVMMSYSDMDFRRAVITFKAYCQNEFVSKPIVNQCWYYLMYLHMKHGCEQFPSLILDAPNYLLEAHMSYLTERLIYRHPVFRLAHRDFLRQMTRHLRYEFIMPGSTIVEAGDKRKRMFFVAEGTVIAIHEKKIKKSYEFLYAGACFGEIQAMHGTRFQTTYKAVTAVQVFGIRTKDWAYLLRWFPATGRVIMNTINSGEAGRAVTQFGGFENLAERFG